MKKTLLLIPIILMMCVCFSACNHEKSNTNAIDKKIVFSTLTVDGNNVSGEVANEITSFSFLDEIETHGNVEYAVSLDIYGREVVPTKTVALQAGNNTFYVLATLDEYSEVYTVTIRRRPMYNVFFETDGGTITESQTIEEGGCAIVPENPIKEGYSFIAWEYEFETPVMSDIIIKSQWSANTYKITYNANGGSVNNSTQTVNYDDSYTLEAPTRAGYTFAGWYDGENRYYGGTWKTLSDVTLKAKWNIDTYNISYVINGGTHSNPKTYTIEDEFELIAPTRTGYTFLGWTYEGKTTPLLNVKILKGCTENKKYTANWSVNTYKVIYDANGGSVNNSTQTVNYDSSYTLEVPTRAGYTFAGWYDGENRYYGGTWKTLSDVTLKAKWNIDTYNISYVNNGGTHSNPKTYTIEDEFELTAPTRTGYTFLGWTYEGKTTPLLNVKILKGCTGNKKYTANWSVNTYKVIYDANGGSVNNSTQTVNYDSSYTLEVPTRAGYTFAGWYDGENRYYGGTWKTLSDVTLKAKWNINSYYVSVNGTSGGSVSGSGHYEYNSTVTVFAKTKLGYTWLGWYDTDDNIVSTKYIYSFTIGDTNITLNAKWKISDDISDFEFTSTETTCTITGVVDDSKNTYTIPKYATSIGEWAFFMCDYLTNITIPNGVTSIGGHAFSGCNNLATIVILDSVTTIGEQAFSSCDSLTNVVIPKSVTSISEYMFSSCGNLTTVVIPDSITFIGKNAFSGCTKLTSITFKGKTSEWNAITLGNNWNFMIPATQVVCSDGIVALDKG